MRHLIGSAGMGIAGFAAGIALVLSCSQDPGSAGTGLETIGLETIGLETTTASAEPGLEETCMAWRVTTHNLTQSLPKTFDPPAGEFPFAVIVGGSYVLITRKCLD